MAAWIQARLRGFAYSDDGPTATEYAVMLALIVVVCLATLSQFGQGLLSLNTINNAMMFAGS
ncbi:MAG: Flp family type IVb pilin [Phycisphaerae bacterium]